MEAILEKNIRNALAARNISLAQLSRLSNVPYRTLQDILALKQAAKITTVAAIAAGLGTTAGKLLEPPNGMEAKPVPQEKTREQLFAALVEKAIHLDKDGLALLLAALDAGLSDSDCEPMSRLKNDK